MAVSTSNAIRPPKGPARWETPYDPEQSPEDAARILATAPLGAMDPKSFPDNLPLEGLVRGDARLRRFRRGDVVIRAGEYGTSVFLLMSGRLRVALDAGFERAEVGARAPRHRGLLGAFTALFHGGGEPEAREESYLTDARVRGEGDAARFFLQDVPRVLDAYGTAPIEPGEIFGEMAAMSRTPRVATVFAEEDSEVVDIRWQGVRDLRRVNHAFRDHIDRLYRERGLTGHLAALPFLSHLDDEALALVAEATTFESHGEFEWFGRFKQLAGQGGQQRVSAEPIIARAGDQVDGLILVRAGFARVSEPFGVGERTVGYEARGAIFGLAEIAHNWFHLSELPLQRTIRAVGYADILRIPTRVVEDVVLPDLPPERLPPLVAVQAQTETKWEAAIGEEVVDPGFLEFMADSRFLNGSAAMVIDLERCVRCDDCVKACALAHDGNPRFVRHGQRHGRHMIANACMHCADPVCMIGCPTGAIQRDAATGNVVINDATCIGCATCANSCPYDNIRMAEIRWPRGELRRHDTGMPVLKATKCDLCIELPGGPACQRACAHDALVRADMSDLSSLAAWFNR